MQGKYAHLPGAERVACSECSILPTATSKKISLRVAAAMNIASVRYVSQLEAAATRPTYSISLTDLSVRKDKNDAPRKMASFVHS
jgi:hypothetical protein